MNYLKNIVNRSRLAAYPLGTICLAGYAQSKWNQRMAFADGQKKYRCYFDSAATLNPKFDKRFKMGEDHYLVKDKFICCLDGVGGWIEVLIDSGKMTKQLIKIIEDVYSSGDYEDLQDLLEKSIKRVTVGGSTTFSACALDDADILDDINLRSCNLGDSGFLLMRPQDGGLVQLHRSKSQ